jgi:hypothetical protein
MALELTGKLIKVLNPQSGQGKNGTWQKQEFVIETADQYPKKICITAWSEKVDDLAKFSMGDNLKVSVNLESREYNEKWYTEARAWRIEADNGGSSNSNNNNSGNSNNNRQAPPTSTPDDFGFEPYTPSKANVSAADDDLPF